MRQPIATLVCLLSDIHLSHSYATCIPLLYVLNSFHIRLLFNGSPIQQLSFLSAIDEMDTIVILVTELAPVRRLSVKKSMYFPRICCLNREKNDVHKRSEF